MRLQWIVSVLAGLVSMGLLVIIFGQHQLLIILNKGMERLQMESETLDNTLAKEEFFMLTVEKLEVKGTRVVDDLESMVAKLRGAVEWKKTENDKCQEEKQKNGDELADKEKEHNETEAIFKSDSDAWNAETTSLKAQLTEYRPICDYVKKNPLATKLCDNKESDPPPEESE